MQLLDGAEPEVDAQARIELADALNLAVLGEDEALSDLYTIAGYEPKAKPDELFGHEKGPLVRQLQLFRQADARGAQGRGYAIAHLDLAAEALLRAAYLRYGDSEDIKSRIETEERKDVKYGALIESLSSVKQLKGVQGQLLALHELRGERTEVTPRRLARDRGGVRGCSRGVPESGGTLPPYAGRCGWVELNSSHDPPRRASPPDVDFLRQVTD